MISKLNKFFYICFLCISFQGLAFGTSIIGPRLCGYDDAECKKIRFIVPIVEMNILSEDPVLTKKLRDSFRQALKDLNSNWGNKYEIETIRSYKEEKHLPIESLSFPDDGDLLLLTMNARSVEIGGKKYVLFAFYMNRGGLDYNGTRLGFYPGIIEINGNMVDPIKNSLECNLSVHLNQKEFRRKATGQESGAWNEKCK